MTLRWLRSRNDFASEMASLPVMTLVDTEMRWVIASFSQGALAFVDVGDEVELAFDRLPGRTLTGQVESIIPGTGQCSKSHHSPRIRLSR